MGLFPSDKIFLTLQNEGMKKLIQLPPDSPKWKLAIADALNIKGQSMKEVSLALGRGETFIRDVLKRNREPSALKLRDINNYLGIGSKNPQTSVGAIPVIGKVRAGDWLDVESVENAEVENMEYVPATTDYPIDWQYAFTVEGQSINKTAKSGDRLVCLDCIKSGIAIEHDDLVIIERSKHSGQMIERTAKRVRKTSAGFELWPESTDPNHQNPIVLDGETDGVSVRIMAKVIWILSKP